MSEIELKPCPFCGGTKLKTGGDDKVVGVWCLTCQAAGPNHYGSREWNDRADFDARIRSAIERKPEPVDSRELIERLVKALRNMLAMTDPYREGRGTEAEIAARRDAVAALNAFDSATLAAKEQQP